MNLRTGIIIGFVAFNLQAQSAFEDFFTDQTMRVDYIHSGTAKTEAFSVDEIYIESVWAGSHKNLIDTLNLGKYLFEIYDVKTNQLIYSRGFCSIFGEWQTTDEAKNRRRAFSESIRFPNPKNKVKITLSSRDDNNIFMERWAIPVDPSKANIRRTNFYENINISKILDNGDPATKVDILILPDGYTKKEMKNFLKDAREMCDVLFATSPFKERKSDFNILAMELPSNASGIDNPRKEVYVDNALSCSFNSFESDRYILTWDNKTVCKAASAAPYDQLYILINSKKYGGGGIFNLYSTCIADNEWSGYIFVHEFGHAFAGLGDEYYTSDVAYDEFYNAGVEPWEPNVTALMDKKNVKWKALMDDETLVPTPWDKVVFDSTNRAHRKTTNQLKEKAAKDSAKAAHDQWRWDFLRAQEAWGTVGVFEGSGYSSEGLYRPYLDCRMFSRSLTGFDPVCLRAIEQMIDFYSE
ncbi:peptidase M64 [candidate division KSB1 bacterium]|nr:peptidase M64 [candidate division KSB1 bacterium]